MHTPSFHLAEPISPVDHASGPQSAPVTVVEYGDFECPNCKQATGAMKLLFARFEHRIRFVFRHFPLEEVHPYALRAAQAAECAGGQGRFWPMHDVLFEHQPHFQLAQLSRYAQTLGLDMARFTAEMNDEVYLQRVREHQRSVNDSGVRATPTFFVNGRIQDVSYGLHSLYDAVEAALNAGRGSSPATQSASLRPIQKASTNTMVQSWPASVCALIPLGGVNLDRRTRTPIRQISFHEGVKP